MLLLEVLLVLGLLGAVVAPLLVVPDPSDFAPPSPDGFARLSVR